MSQIQYQFPPPVTTLDWIVVAIYCVIVFIVGSIQHRYIKKSWDWMLGSKKMVFWLLAIAYFTILFSAHDILTYTEEGYLIGLASIQMWWDDIGWILIFLALLPILYYGGYTTSAEYLEYRFGPAARLVGAICIFWFVFAIMGFNFYAAGITLEVFAGIDRFWGMLIFATITTVYAALGGIFAAVLTDLLQALVVWIVGTMILIPGLATVGWWDGLFALTPLPSRSFFTAPLHPDFPALGMFFAGGLAITGAWYFFNQANLQTNLAARTLNQARIVTLLFACVLMPFGSIYMGIPGMIVRALVEKGLIPPLPNTAHTFFHYVAIFAATPGLMGAVLAYFLAALMSTGDLYVVACSSTFVNDIYRRFIVKGKPEIHYRRMLLIMALILGILGSIAWYQFYVRVPYLAQALFGSTPAVSPAMCLMLLAGMLTYRAAPTATWIAGAAGVIYTLLCFLVPDIFLAPFTFGLWPKGGSWWFPGFACFVVTVVLLFILTPFFKPKPKEVLKGLVWTPRLEELEEMYFKAVAEGKRGIFVREW
jgi:SSS family solute:Na+ symporter